MYTRYAASNKTIGDFVYTEAPIMMHNMGNKHDMFEIYEVSSLNEEVVGSNPTRPILFLPY